MFEKKTIFLLCFVQFFKIEVKKTDVRSFCHNHNILINKKPFTCFYIEFMCSLYIYFAKHNKDAESGINTSLY